MGAPPRTRAPPLRSNSRAAKSISRPVASAALTIASWMQRSDSLYRNSAGAAGCPKPQNFRVVRNPKTSASLILIVWLGSVGSTAPPAG